MTTATRTRKPTAKSTKGSFDHEKMLAERDKALSEALHEAADLPSLKAALKRVLQANVQLRLQRNVSEVFDSIELKYEDCSFRASVEGTLYLKVVLRPDVTVMAGHGLSQRDLFKGLPELHVFSPDYSGGVLKPEHNKVEGYFDLRVTPKEDATSFVMFELTLAQLRSAAQAWRTTQNALVAQEQARVRRDNTPEAEAFKALAELEDQHAALTQQLADLAVELDKARRVAQDMRESMARKVNATTPPLLQHLNALRAQMGLPAL